jgi:hypothetical protein
LNAKQFWTKTKSTIITRIHWPDSLQQPSERIFFNGLEWLGKAWQQIQIKNRIENIYRISFEHKTISNKKNQKSLSEYIAQTPDISLLKKDFLNGLECLGKTWQHIQIKKIYKLILK